MPVHPDVAGSPAPLGPGERRVGELTGPEEDFEVADRRSWRESRRVG